MTIEIPFLFTDSQKVTTFCVMSRYHAHKQNEYEIHYFIEGSSILCNKTRYPISKGKLFLTGPIEFHSIIPEPHPTEISWYAFLFSLDETKEADQKLKASLIMLWQAKTPSKRLTQTFAFNLRIYINSPVPQNNLSRCSLSLLMSFLWRWFGPNRRTLKFRK